MEVPLRPFLGGMRGRRDGEDVWKVFTLSTPETLGRLSASVLRLDFSDRFGSQCSNWCIVSKVTINRIMSFFRQPVISILVLNASAQPTSLVFFFSQSNLYLGVSLPYNITQVKCALWLVNSVFTICPWVHADELPKTWARADVTLCGVCDQHRKF